MLITFYPAGIHPKEMTHNIENVLDTKCSFIIILLYNSSELAIQ